MNLRFEISDLRRVWWWLRQVSGDAAYENYVRSRGTSRHRAAEKIVLSREEFYLDMLRRRYSGVSRCC